MLECCRGFNLNGPPWKRQRRRQDVRGKFSQIGCGSRHDTSTRVWGATQRLRSTNWATPLEGVGGSCTFQRVGLSLPPLHWRPFSGSARQVPSIHPVHPTILPSNTESPPLRSPTRPPARLTFDVWPVAYRMRESSPSLDEPIRPVIFFITSHVPDSRQFACLLPPRKSECRVIYHGAQANTQIKQPGRGIRFPIPRLLTALSQHRGPRDASRCGPCMRPVGRWCRDHHHFSSLRLLVFRPHQQKDLVVLHPSTLAMTARIATQSRIVSS